MIAAKKQRTILRDLLEFITLQLIKSKPMHGYEIITEIEKTFGQHFGPSITYPLLADLEENNYVTNNWDMENVHPRKVYRITEEGNKLLEFAENTLDLIFKKTNTTPICDT